MDLQKVRNGINYISNGSVRKVIEDLCDELEKHELDFLALENEHVQCHTEEQGNYVPLRKIQKVVEKDAPKKRSSKQKKSMASEEA